MKFSTPDESTLVRMSCALAVICVLFTGWSPAAAASGGIASEKEKIEAAAKRASQTAPPGTPMRVIVQVAGGQIHQVQSRLQARGGTVKREHSLLNAFSAEILASDLPALGADGGVTHVSLDAIVTAATINEPDRAASIFQDTLLATLGVTGDMPTGKGVGVAVLDSGIDASPTLQPFASYDFLSGGQPGNAADEFGHGTHVAGLIAGAGPETAAGSHGQEKQGARSMRGIAPAVRLVSLRVLDRNGRGWTSTVIAALEYVVQHRERLGIDVVNLSLGHLITEPAATDPLVQAVEAATREGVIVVVAAGNWGRHVAGQAGYAGITSPGNAPSAITVGALDTRDTVTRSDDIVATYSSRGPTWYDAWAKPDLVAPGHNLVSYAAVDSALYQQYPERRLADEKGQRNYLRLSGTSMATAVTTGAVALLIEQQRRVSTQRLTANEVKAILQFTSLPVPGEEGLAQGTGALNPSGAVALVTSRATSSTPSAVTTLGSEAYVWAQHIVWGTNIVWGTTINSADPAWAANIVWGTAIEWGQMWTADANGAPVWNDPDTWSTSTVWGWLTLTVEGLVKTVIWGNVDRSGSTIEGSAKTVIWGNGF